MPSASFARHPAHHRIDRGEVDRDVGMLDGAGIEQRHHQIDVVVRPLDVERRALLPMGPDGAHGADVLAHPGPGRRPGQAVAPLDVRLDLRAQPQREAALAELAERPGAHRRHRRAAREGDRDGSADAELRRRLRGQRHQDERVVLGLLDHHAVIADLLEQAGIAADAREIERYLRRAQARIDLAEREKGFEPHRVSLQQEGLTLRRPRSGRLEGWARIATAAIRTHKPLSRFARNGDFAMLLRMRSVGFIRHGFSLARSRSRSSS